MINNSIEITLKDQRAIANQLLTELRNLGSMRANSIFAEDRQLAKLRNEAVAKLGRELLGRDWDCQQLC